MSQSVKARQLDVDPGNNMSVRDAIFTRRSVRSYENQSLSFDTIYALLRAAVQAPTAVHEEPWVFAVIENKELLKRLSDDAKRTMDDIERKISVPGRQMVTDFKPPEDIFYHATALIVIFGKPMGPFVAADCWLAAQNLMLAAQAMNLGTCVIGLAVSILNTPEWKKTLNVPDDLTAIAPIIVGIPHGKTRAIPRKEPQILTWK